MFKLLLFILLIIPLNVQADVSIECSKIININDNINCDININTDELINGFESDIKLSGNIEYVDFSTNKNYLGDASNKKIGLYTNNSIKGLQNLGTLILKIKDTSLDINETISLVNSSYSNQNFDKISIPNKSVNIKISSNNNLSNLELSIGDINFSKDILKYDVETTSSFVNIKAEKEDSNAIISGDIGKKELNYGINTFNIYVTSETGIKKKYTLNITRIKDNNSNINTNTNSNKDNKNNDDDKEILHDIKIENKNIDFSSDKYEYQLNIDYNTNKLDISTITNNNVRVEITGNDNLKVGENVIIIRVYSTSDNIIEYKLIVNKKDKEDVLSSNNYLKSLVIKNYSINFDKDKTTYNLKINKEEYLDITALAEDSLSSVIIKNNDKLRNNDVIKIIVTAENGSEREYLINIEKGNDDYLLIIVITFELIIITVIFTIIIIKNKRKNRDIN